MERLSRALVAAIAELVEAYSGLALLEGQQRALEQGIVQRVRAIGCPGLPEYLALLRSDDARELQNLVEVVANSETGFFRNQAHFRALREVVLPDLALSGHPVRIWSAGCSTGEEPYGIAIACLESGLVACGREVSIVGTDISRAALDAARRGEYCERRLANVPPEVRARYFERRGDRWRVGDTVRRLVSFWQHNLVDPNLPVPPGSVDVIFCQNVTIYFRPEVVARVTERLTAALREGGYLLPGYSETAWYRAPGLVSISLGDALFYRKVGDAASPDGRAEETRRAPRPARAQPDGTRPGACPAAGDQDGATGADLARAEQEVARNPLSEGAWERLGLLYRRLERLGDAERAFRRLLYLAPESPVAHFHLGALLQETGRAPEARREFRIAKELLEALPPQTVVGGVAAGWLLDACRRAVADGADRTSEGSQDVLLAEGPSHRSRVDTVK